MKKKLTICLDFDGVIADTGELKRIVASELIGKRVPLHQASGERVRAGQSILTENEWQTAREMVYFDKKTIARLKPVPHSIRMIKKWLRDGHVVKVVTARTGPMRDDAIRLLKKHGVAIEVIGVGEKKTKIEHLRQCDIFVDDDLDRVREAKVVARQALFFKWPYNDGERGIKSIKSLKDISIKT